MKNCVHIHLWKFEKNLFKRYERLSKAAVCTWIEDWNQNSIDRKCCSYLSISIFSLYTLYPVLTNFCVIGISKYLIFSLIDMYFVHHFSFHTNLCTKKLNIIINVLEKYWFVHQNSILGSVFIKFSIFSADLCWVIIESLLSQLKN